MKRKTPQAPATLSPEGKKLWRQILTDFPTIEDRAHLKVLEVALLALDREERCRRQIDADGEMVPDRFDILKPHGLLSSERDARAAFYNGIRALGLSPETGG